MEDTTPFPEQSRRRSRPLKVVSENAEPISAIEAEASLLSCVLNDEGGGLAARCVAAKLTPAAFYLPRHRIVAEKIFDRVKTGGSIDLAILGEELRRSEQLEQIGGYLFLTELTQLQPTGMRFLYFLERVRDVWLTREAAKRGQELAGKAAELGDGNAGELIASYALKLQRMADYLLRANRESLRERMAQRLKITLESAAGKVDRSRWVYFGLPWLDACLKPLDTRAEDWYNIIGGPPSGGKSSFMRHVAIHNARAGKRVVVFLLETGLRWTDAAAATMARVNLRFVENGEALPEMVRRYEAAHEELQQLADNRLFVFEDLVYVEDIERQVRELNRTLRERDLAAGVPEAEARGLDIAVVDYLQIVTTRQNFRGHREQIIAHVSMSLKRLFKGLDIVSLVGAQINRAAREDAAKPPTLAALRESGAIEQDADRVIFVHTPPEDKTGAKQDGNNLTDEVEIIQRKSRNGPRDVSVGVHFHKQQTRYEEIPQVGVARPGLPRPDGYGRKPGGAS